MYAIFISSQRPVTDVKTQVVSNNCTWQTVLENLNICGSLTASKYWNSQSLTLNLTDSILSMWAFWNFRVAYDQINRRIPLISKYDSFSNLHQFCYWHYPNRSGYVKFWKGHAGGNPSVLYLLSQNVRPVFSVWKKVLISVYTVQWVCSLLAIHIFRSNGLDETIFVECEPFWISVNLARTYDDFEQFAEKNFKLVCLESNYHSPFWFNHTAFRPWVCCSFTTHELVSNPFSQIVSCLVVQFSIRYWCVLC